MAPQSVEPNVGFSAHRDFTWRVRCRFLDKEFESTCSVKQFLKQNVCLVQGVHIPSLHDARSRTDLTGDRLRHAQPWPRLHLRHRRLREVIISFTKTPTSSQLRTTCQYDPNCPSPGLRGLSGSASTRGRRSLARWCALAEQCA